jgi:hypothetical protein
VAIAVGTIGAVVVALFGGWLRARLVPPKLALRLVDDRGRETPVLLTAPNGDIRKTVGRWYHLRVVNERRWSPVTEVQVFLLIVSRSQTPRVSIGLHGSVRYQSHGSIKKLSL